MNKTMDEIINRVIQIESMSEDMKKVNIQTGRDKFSLWKKKKDGYETKAYESFSSMMPKVGDTVDIGYKEEDAEFVNEKGKTVQFKRRTIISMREADGREPSPAPVSPRNSVLKFSETSGQKSGIEYVRKDEYEKKMEELRESYLFMAQQIKDIKDSLK